VKLVSADEVVVEDEVLQALEGLVLQDLIGSLLKVRNHVLVQGNPHLFQLVGVSARLALLIFKRHHKLLHFLRVLQLVRLFEGLECLLGDEEV